MIGDDGDTTMLARAHLFRLISPALPVGAYSYSQGLEWTVEEGTVCDEASAAAWIGDALRLVIARFEAPIALRLHRAWRGGSLRDVRRWNDLFIASRETAELRAETIQMGYSLKRLLGELAPQRGPAPAASALLAQVDPCAFPTAFACAAAETGVSEQDMVLGLFWAWAENQVMAALKAIPLGQAAGQRILVGLAELLPSLTLRCLGLADDDLCNFAPGFAIASTRHESQYSRLFRS